jgi:hypothetical protein
VPNHVPKPLWLTLPIAIGGLTSSAAGAFAPFVYAAETTNWGAQGRGQDVVNLAVFPALVVVAFLTLRGSLRAYLIWLGLVLYSAYSYLIYAGFVHFGPLFPVYVATFGVSFYAAAWGFMLVDPARLRDLFAAAPRRTSSAFLLIVAALFYLLELSTDLAAIMAGTEPQGLKETGLFVDPVHVLDMALLLPAMIIAAVSLWRGGGLGYLLAPPLLAFLGTLTIAIGGMFVSMAASGVPIVWPMVSIFAISAALSFALLVRLLMSLPKGAPLAGVLRFAQRTGKATGEAAGGPPGR